LRIQVFGLRPARPAALNLVVGIGLVVRPRCRWVAIGDAMGFEKGKPRESTVRKVFGLKGIAPG